MGYLPDGFGVGTLEMLFFYIGIGVAIAVGGFAFSDYCDAMTTSLASWFGVALFVTIAMMVFGLFSLFILYKHPLTGESSDSFLGKTNLSSKVGAVALHAQFFAASGFLALLSAMQTGFLWNYTKNDPEFQSTLNHGFPMTTASGWGFSVQRKNDFLLSLQVQLPLALTFVAYALIQCLAVKRTVVTTK